MADEQFHLQFQQLTGHEPLSWQRRLYCQWIENDVKPVIDLPTGLGKTMVMAIWLIARAKNRQLGRRLIYVVDRRTVVDQATDLAEQLAARPCIEFLERNFGGPPVISTLRGQLADNREWSRDPSKLAIIIGTVDLIGSALLFSGYRSSFKQRPLHAGLLGQDSLLVLDEAHLSTPFQKLIKAIDRNGRFQNDRNHKPQGAPLQAIRMSATSDESTDDGRPFTIDPDPSSRTYDLKTDPDPETGNERNEILKRFTARKQLHFHASVESTKLNEALAKAAITLALDAAYIGKRIVVFVRKPEDAKAIAETIQKYEVKTEDVTGSKPKTAKSTPFSDSVKVLTGTMRGLERDELVRKPVFTERWLNGDLKASDQSNQVPVFLVSTSAGEVGFDLNGDHLVGDAAPLDSWIQRLGRVNRRGNADATVILINEKEPADKTDFDKACIAASRLFVNGMDVSLSPKALAAFKLTLSCDQLKAASTPAPGMVELTDILLDAWSMTSIIEPMPGRPEVAPWIRGIADELPQTTIAWRAELDLPGFDQLDLETIEEWLDTHRVLTHESLSVPTSAAAKWFTDRWVKLDDRQRSEIGRRSIIVDRAGLKLITIKELIDQLARKGNDSTAAIRNADLILPASFGGVERHKGLLDADAPEIPKDESKQSAEDRAKAVSARQAAPDVADEHGRYRELITKTEDGAPVTQIIGSGIKPPPKPSNFVIDLESDDKKRVQLVSYVPKQEKLEWGSKKQLLSEHAGLVQKRLDEILGRLALPPAVKQAAQLAADFHDHGKNRERWQRTVDGTATVGTTAWLEQTKLEGDGKHQTLGKSGGEMKRDPRGYRHEFGSLREFIDANQSKPTQEVTELAMHLIAVHHGRGRPHFPRGGFDPDAESRSSDIHTGSIRRFARLQRKYGWWHLAWLENLLRCADALASAELDGTDGGAK